MDREVEAFTLRARGREYPRHDVEYALGKAPAL
jgi:hypothetical protein